MRKYLVLALRTGRWNDSVIQPHRDWLAEVRAQNRLDCTGRFTDGSGGAYVVLAENLAAARELVFTDPIHTTGASELTVYEWEITG
ncbi:YciI family protein [Nocardia sp. CDC159]|uniref:YciI family protein n=1 Tax=Nocardia pulmonis TaxID=2951408 RepID=A0A9X2EES0_9NOCA|nr:MULTISPECIES: YciI family protein [Nocardia]MCM6776821.1 YciI family protein [Nocardia pulmonis]MCM6789030.1 YciI family protein [Nocardia sp. CDC159]